MQGDIEGQYRREHSKACERGNMPKWPCHYWFSCQGPSSERAGGLKKKKKKKNRKIEMAEKIT